MAARLLVLIVAPAAVLVAQTQPAINGLDHVNIAVADLDSAAERYRDLGFSLKPGTPHANGIQNRHVKFPDGTELELITAPAATDALTATYRRHLELGDAPAFLALFGPPGADLSAERRLLKSGGASLVEERVYAPEPLATTVAHVPDGEVWLLPPASQRLPGRKIVGVTVRVRSADSARRILAQHLHQDVAVVLTRQGTSVFLPPHLTHGLWLELRQPS